ncbi:MAG: aminopeptidase P N-terminal domain-containing protein [Erysipelotrichaceae bacterium]|nr:aminopeptidase P N-terminal domain-containing protein [Erysipelotrichaceae bacterium]
MYKTRREKLLAAVPDNSVTVLFAGTAPYAVGDEKYPFEVDRSFYYFTGLDREGLALMLVKRGSNTRETLFIEPYDELQAKWVGGRIREDEARQISAIEDIRDVNTLKDAVASLLIAYGGSSEMILCGDLSRQEIEQPRPTVEFFNEIKRQMPDVLFRNIYADIVRLRTSKSEDEVLKLRRAIEITKTGIETMMSYCHEGIWENELEAYFDFTLKCNQCGHAFDTICATGKNATVLHYTANNQRALPNDLVLCDLGARYQYYNADITRTFPVGGKFTERQKVLYDIVLRGNKMIASLARPGVTTRWLNEQLLAFYEVELQKIGLLDDGRTIRDYYWHGVSHYIGLETHDVTLPDLPLSVGSVISDEPGLYLEDEGIGIRIEDDLLIVEGGCEVLSKDIIKEIDEIEAFMAGNQDF